MEAAGPFQAGQSSPTTTSADGSQRGVAAAARVYLRKAGSPSGVVMRMPEAWSELVDKAAAKFGIKCAKFHLQTGDELEEDGLCLLGPGEVIYVSDDSQLASQLSPPPPIASNHLQPMPSFLDLSNESVQSRSPRSALLGDPAIPPSRRGTMVVNLARLAHHLQRERGTSSTWVASGRTLAAFGALLAEYRPAVDGALKQITEAEPDKQRWADTLGQLLATERHAIDAAPDSIEGRKGEAAAFYAALRGFTVIIAQVLAEAAAVVEFENSSAAATATFVQFSRLKECQALQRGFLSGALALPTSAVDSIPTRAFADLVVCVHQSKIHLQSLQGGAPTSFLEIIAPAFSLEEQLRKVQDTLESDFDLRAVRASISVERCWDLYSAHVDKMQRLEATLAAEVHRSDQSNERHREHAESVLSTTIDQLNKGDGSAPELATAATSLQHVQPKVIKAELLRMLTTKRQQEATAPAAAEPPAAANKRARGGDAEAASSSSATAAAGGSSNGAKKARGDNKARESSGADRPSAWAIGLDELKLEKRVGVGSSGTTYLAQWRGAQVAVKVAGAGINKLGEWRAEVAALTQLRHPHVVQYLGAVQEPPTHCLVLEYCGGGDVRSALRSATPPGFVMRVAEGIASGMAYLHRKGIMHRDLKSANVLIDGGGAVKLTDFGVATEVHEGGTSSLEMPDAREMTAETGTLRWMAPEVARHEKYRKSADVYSFGMVLFELVTHEVPFADRLPLQAAVATSLYGYRPTLPPDTPTQLARLVEACWHATPTERPSFEQTTRSLADLRSELSEAETSWLDAPRGHPVYEGVGETTAAE